MCVYICIRICLYTLSCSFCLWPSPRERTQQLDLKGSYYCHHRRHAIHCNISHPSLSTHPCISLRNPCESEKSRKRAQIVSSLLTWTRNFTNQYNTTTHWLIHTHSSVCAQSLSHAQLFASPQFVAHQAHLSKAFPWQIYPLPWVAISCSRETSWAKNQTYISCTHASTPNQNTHPNSNCNLILVTNIASNFFFTLAEALSQ